jgi:hypothetical protein
MRSGSSGPLGSPNGDVLTSLNCETNGKPFPPLTGHWSGRNRAPPSVLIGGSGWGVPIPFADYRFQTITYQFHWKLFPRSIPRRVGACSTTHDLAGMGVKHASQALEAIGCGKPNDPGHSELAATSRDAARRLSGHPALSTPKRKPRGQKQPQCRVLCVGIWLLVSKQFLSGITGV